MVRLNFWLSWRLTGFLSFNLIVILLAGLVSEGLADRPLESLEDRLVKSYQTRLYSVIDQISLHSVTLRQPEGSRPLPPRQSSFLSGGSGVLIANGQFVLTNDHVVPNSRPVQVIFHNGEVSRGVVWARDPRGDMALLKLGQAFAGKTLKWAKTQQLEIGTPVLAIGNALGLSVSNGEASVSFGVISALHRYQGGARVYSDAIQFDAPVNPGNSGGGLFDLSGQFLGLTGRISTRGQRTRNVGVAYAIPAHRIRKVLPKLLAGEDIERGYLGLVFDPLTTGEGLLVARVKANSPSDLAGLKAQDRIIKANGKPLSSALSFMNELSDQWVGEVIRFEIQRFKNQQLETLEFSVILDRYR